MWTKMRMMYIDRIFEDTKDLILSPFFFKDLILYSCYNGTGIHLLKKRE